MSCLPAIVIRLLLSGYSARTEKQGSVSSTHGVSSGKTAETAGEYQTMTEEPTMPPVGKTAKEEESMSAEVTVEKVTTVPDKVSG